jgi:SAM-dependent methyltransferase
MKSTAGDTMLKDRLKWNEKYRRKDYPVEPSVIVKTFCGLARGTAALDIAAGSGRNALLLAARGFTVEAVDVAEEGLALLAGRHPAIRTVCADLDAFDIPAGRYDLIVNVLFLNRRLFPQIREGLTPGGLLIFETLLEPRDEAERSRHCRDYFLRPNELLHGFLALRVLYYREGPEDGPDDPRQLASLVAVRER